MLNQLIESRSHGADNRKRGGFFLATFFLVGLVLSSGVLWSLFAKDLAMGGESLELSAIIAPLPEVKNEPPAPVQRQQARPQPAQASNAALPMRRTNTARIDEMQPAPDKVSVAANTERARPNGKFFIGDNDIDPRSFGAADERSGNDVGGTGISQNDKAAQSEIIEKVPPPPPPALIVKKKPEEAAQKPKAPVSLGVVNGKAKTLPVPVYSAAAKAVNAVGNVDVQVLIDENGSVVSAKAVSGHLLLRDSAERAARGARFSPTTLSNQPVKVTGVIVYKFSM